MEFGEAQSKENIYLINHAYMFEEIEHKYKNRISDILDKKLSLNFTNDSNGSRLSCSSLCFRRKMHKNASDATYIYSELLDEKDNSIIYLGDIGTFTIHQTIINNLDDLVNYAANNHED